LLFLFVGLKTITISLDSKMRAYPLALLATKRLLSSLCGAISVIEFNALIISLLLISLTKNAIDEYLQTCTQLGRKPQKTYKGVFNVRIDPKLHQKLHQEALKSGLSLNAFVQKVLSAKISKA
jgi:predicted HicB family RNase H-like nuclease